MANEMIEATIDTDETKLWCAKCDKPIHRFEPKTVVGIGSKLAVFHRDCATPIFGPLNQEDQGEHRDWA